MHAHNVQTKSYNENSSHNNTTSVTVLIGVMFYCNVVVGGVWIVLVSYAYTLLRRSWLHGWWLG